jgi:hypothetical protein
MSFYANKKAIEYYANHSIEQRLVKVINLSKNNDKRYYIFRNVLSSSTVIECLKVLPSIQNLRSIQVGGRQFDEDPSCPNAKKLQKIVREANVLFRQRSKSAAKEVGIQQEMKIPEFYLAVASKLGIMNARLGLTDRLVVHEPKLKVFYFFYSENYTSIYLNMNYKYFFIGGSRIPYRCPSSGYGTSQWSRSCAWHW